MHCHPKLQDSLMEWKSFSELIPHPVLFIIMCNQTDKSAFMMENNTVLFWSCGYNNVFFWWLTLLLVVTMWLLIVTSMEGEGQVLHRRPMSGTRDRDAEAGDVTTMLLHSWQQPVTLNSSKHTLLTKFWNSAGTKKILKRANLNLEIIFFYI